jgi:two-component system, NtrC family, sensor kinase
MIAHLRDRLAFRIGAGVCAGTALILFVAGAWNLHLQRAHLTRMVSASAENIAETIRMSTRDAMMRDDREALRRTIDNIAAQPGIERIRIFNKEGRIRTSTRPEEVGTQVDIGAEACYACHQRDRPLERLDGADRVRIFHDPGGRRVLGVIAPIHNEVQCTGGCHAHNPAQSVLGVLDVQLSMAGVEEDLSASERQMVGGLAASVAAVLFLGGFLVWRMVLGPVQRLTGAMARVAGGDLDISIPVASADEIGEMTGSWNTMTEQLRRARQALQDWNRTLEERVAEKARELETAHGRVLVVEKMASLGKLAAVVAHEINNPLAGIRTYARLLRRRLASPAPPDTPARAAADEEADRILQVVDSEAGRCGEIVRNMLMFSRAPEARLASHDLGPVLERCWILLRHQAELLGVELVLDAEPDLPGVVCDASQMEQMVLALALNGLEATPSGGRVVISARREQGGVALAVSDTGCGIPEESRTRIFEPFFTTKEAGKGVGLGLAVVWGIVTRHRGRIDLSSDLGSGSVFTVHLPCQQEATT